jgi:hypothetical protein
MPVVEMEELKMALFFHPDGGEIIEEDRLATEITELDSFDAHMPSFLAGCFLEHGTAQKVSLCFHTYGHSDVQ